MTSVWQFLWGWKRRTVSPDGAVQRSVEHSIEVTARRLHEADPDTARQWQYLRIALERHPVPAALLGRRSARLEVRPAVALAVIAAVVATAGVLWLRHPESTVYATRRGEQSSMTLPDGSEVSLNHTSELVVERRSSGGARTVALKGEAFFQVRRSGEQFTVTTEAGHIRVLGTEFNVRVRGRRLEVAVVSGRVQVTAAHDGRDSTVFLDPGQITTCDPGGFPVAPVPLPFAGYPGWKHGHLFFFRSDLPSICRELESHFDVPVRIGNTVRTEGTITGVLDITRIETSLTALSRLTRTAYRHENGGYLLY